MAAQRAPFHGLYPHLDGEFCGHSQLLGGVALTGKHQWKIYCRQQSIANADNVTFTAASRATVNCRATATAVPLYNAKVDTGLFTEMPNFGDPRDGAAPRALGLHRTLDAHKKATAVGCRNTL